jgi:hypothetical protein
MPSFRVRLIAFFHQNHDFCHCPDMMGDARFHRRVDAQILVNPSKIVLHEIVATPSQ